MPCRICQGRLVGRNTCDVCMGSEGRGSEVKGRWVGATVVVVWGKKDDVLGKGTRPNVKNGTRKLNLNS